MTIRAVVLAGGKGKRFHGQKQFVNLRGKQLWRHVYDKLLPLVGRENIVVVGVDIPGGSTRNRSVQNGINYFKDGGRVMIFDAARPMVTTEQIKLLMAVEAESATFAMPCVDTLVKIDGIPVNRSEYMSVQTPQVFDFAKLRAAIKNDRYATATDETRVMFDEYGIRPLLIEGSPLLMKVTYPEDIQVLESILSRE